MSDNHEKLRATLNELQSELQQAPALPPEVAARLRAALADVESALRNEPASQATHARRSLKDRLSAIAIDFEASHPTLAGTLESVIDALAAMGI